MAGPSSSMGLPAVYTVFLTLHYRDIAEVQASAPDDIRTHLERMKEFQAQGKMLLAVVFSDPEPPLRTMAVLTSREYAEEFARGDPFVVHGMVEEWHIREGRDLLRVSLEQNTRPRG